MAFTAAFVLLFCGSCLLVLSTAAPHKYVELAYSDYERAAVPQMYAEPSHAYQQCFPRGSACRYNAVCCSRRCLGMARENGNLRRPPIRPPRHCQ